MKIPVMFMPRSPLLGNLILKTKVNEFLELQSQ